MNGYGVALGIGGVMHDYAAAVWLEDRLLSLVSSSEVTGQPHGVDTEAMRLLFETLPVERAIGRWLLSVRRSNVIGDTAQAAIRAAGISPEAVTSIGHTCPELLVPPALPGRRYPINQLDSHAAGVTEASPGDLVLVLDGTGDRGPDGAHEVSAAYTLGDLPRRRWTVHEPASLGVLLDAIGLVAGAAALDRETTGSLTADPARSRGLYASVDDDGYELDGLTWRQMVRPKERQAYLAARGYGQARWDAFARTAFTSAVRVGRDLIERNRGPGRSAWLTGDAFLHSAFAQALSGPGIRPTQWPGDEGTAIGAARLAQHLRNANKQEYFRLPGVLHGDHDQG